MKDPFLKLSCISCPSVVDGKHDSCNISRSSLVEKRRKKKMLHYEIFLLVGSKLQPFAWIMKCKGTFETCPFFFLPHAQPPSGISAKQLQSLFSDCMFFQYTGRGRVCYVWVEMVTELHPVFAPFIRTSFFLLKNGWKSSHSCLGFVLLGFFPLCSV